MDASVRIRHIPHSGFTLVELLVALLIGLLVMVGLHQMFVSSLTAQASTSSQMEVDRAAQVAMDDMTYWLRGAGGGALQGTAGQPYGIRDASPDRVYFTDQSGNNTVRYWLRSGRIYRAFNDNNYSGGAVLASGVTSLLFTYYDANGLPPVAPDQTVRVGIALRIEQGKHSSLLQTAVKLRNK